ncbi:MAG TPA: CocE/NonD family hydrolase [Vicinamibacterales bacterium]
MPLLRALLALAVLSVSAAVKAQLLDNGEGNVELTWGVKIPMRDGVLLNATIYRPRHAAAPVPVLFRMNPYTPDSFHQEAMQLAQHGYAFAAVDVRGRGNSGGAFIPWFNDGRDGADVVEWLSRQPWSNGKVGIFGESYLGRAVWSTLKENPPHLAAAAPIAPGYPVLFWNNIMTPDMMQGLLQMAGVTINQNIAFDDQFWMSRQRKLYLEHLPVRSFDRMAGMPSEIYQRFLDHPAHDRFWSDAAPNAGEYRRITAPLLSITGLYDTHQQSTIYFFEEQLRQAPGAVHFLVIGPWDHGGTTHPRREVGGLKFGPDSVVDINALLSDWFDHTLKGGPLPAFLAKRVTYYVAGAEEWRHADDLGEVTKETRTLYLSSNGEAGDVYHSGHLVPGRTAADAPPDRWTYDPLDTRPEELDRNTVDDWLTNQRYALNLYGAGVVYHGEPFEKATEIAGTPRLSLWMSMDVRDTDFVTTLSLILPDGSNVPLGETALRARYRRSPSRETLVTPGTIDHYDFTFPFHARVAPRGSRLRLVVRSPNTIYWEKNYNSGGEVASESAKDAHTAHVVLYHDAEHPSALDLPLGAH